MTKLACMSHNARSCFKPRSCDTTGLRWSRRVAGRGFRFVPALALFVVTTALAGAATKEGEASTESKRTKDGKPAADSIAGGGAAGGKEAELSGPVMSPGFGKQRVEFTEEERPRLDKGDILVELRSVEGARAPEAIVRAVIDAEPGQVWPLIDRCDDYVGVMPRITRAVEVDRRKELVRCSLTFSPPWPLSDMESTTIAEHRLGPPIWSRVWELESGDYKLNSGHWIVHDFESDPQRTLVEYRLHSEPNVSVPRFLQDMGVKTALPDLIRELRKAVAKRVASQ